MQNYPATRRQAMMSGLRRRAAQKALDLRLGPGAVDFDSEVDLRAFLKSGSGRTPVQPLQGL